MPPSGALQAPEQMDTKILLLLQAALRAAGSACSPGSASEAPFVCPGLSVLCAVDVFISLPWYFPPLQLGHLLLHTTGFPGQRRGQVSRAQGSRAEGAVGKEAGWEGGGRGPVLPESAPSSKMGWGSRRGALVWMANVVLPKSCFQDGRVSGLFQVSGEPLAALGSCLSHTCFLLGAGSFKRGRCLYPGFWLLSRNWEIWEHWSSPLSSLGLSFPICKSGLEFAPC